MSCGCDLCDVACVVMDVKGVECIVVMQLNVLCL